MTTDQTKFYTTAFRRCARTLLIPLLIIVAACGEPPWNNPHPPSPDGQVTYQSAMSPAPPKQNLLSVGAGGGGTNRAVAGKAGGGQSGVRRAR
jgi:hypothetical protein